MEPTEAPILSKGNWGSHKIEGIRDGIVPDTLDLGVIDGVVIVSSDEAIEMARRLSKEEGIFCGISSGCNVSAAIKVARRHPEFKCIVTIINDTGQRYFSTELCGKIKRRIIPEREHTLEENTLKKLCKYRNRWEIIE